MKNSLLLALTIFCAPFSFATAAPKSAAAKVSAPKLTVVLVIDQFRADNIARYEARFLPAKGKSGVGGFRFLLSQGAFFPMAQYDILQPMTGPGHATVLSGSYPYVGGIPLNDWFSREKKREVYCAEDSKYSVVGKFKQRENLGTSPRNLLGTTVGDELKNAGWPSRVVSIALKDRASIFLGGHRADLALWMDDSTFRWVSSEYYLPKKKLPEWMEKLNQRLDARTGSSFVWNHSKDAESSATIFNVQREGKYWKALGDSFPHSITRGTLSELASPAGLDITQEAIEAAVEQYNLGNGKGPDLLAVSYSSHDYVGHAFGPNSRENEEMVVAEDKALAKLFNYLNRRVKGGLKNVLFVLTADHGVAPNSEWLANHQVNAGVVDEKLLFQKLEAALETKYGLVKEKPWLESTSDFNYWINREALAEKKLSLETVAEELKQNLLKEQAFAYAFTEADVRDRKLPPGMHERRILKTYHSGRSGDVVGIVRPFFYARGNTANHMADYSYDETVPLIFAGPGIKPGKFATKAEVVDIAPTLSFLLNTVAPSLSDGRVLSEILK